LISLAALARRRRIWQVLRRQLALLGAQARRQRGLMAAQREAEFAAHIGRELVGVHVGHAVLLVYWCAPVATTVRSSVHGRRLSSCSYSRP
jgi:hypothetical protein